MAPENEDHHGRADILDPCGPQCVAQQLTRFKKAMREHDMAWYDVGKNMTVNIYLTNLQFPLKIYIFPGFQVM
jgi:hypothetical protein